MDQRPDGSRPDEPRSDDVDLGALLDRAGRGDLAAAAAALDRVGPRIRAGIAPRIPARHAAVLGVDDVMQVTYLEALLHVGSQRGADADRFAAWVRAIAEHNLTDAIRALSREKRPDAHPRRPAHGGGDASIDLLEQLLQTSRTPSRDAAAREAAARLRAAVDALPEDYGRAVTLHDLDGLPASEVAARMGRSEGAVHMLRLRARERLRALLSGSSGAWVHA